LRERAKIEDAHTLHRLETLAPALMRERGIDMWILIAREYLEDPALETMLDAEAMSARRRTILLLHTPATGAPERLTVSRYGLDPLFASAWNPETEPDQWKRLTELIVARDPKQIAINTSAATAFADGLTASQYQALLAALPPAFHARLVSGQDLATAFLETRTAPELATYPAVVELAHAILKEGLSRAVITPGTTTTEDVQWWFREKMVGLDPWFHPSVAVFRKGSAPPLSGNALIQPGDLIWTDLGITYLGLSTDTQMLAYVLKPGEADAPAGLRAGLAAANALQDALTSSFRLGASGNAVLADAQAKARAQGITGTIYSHPVGTHGHAAGPAIGFWDNQGPTAAGEGPIRASTLWAIELQATAPIPEWGDQPVPFRQEVNALFDGRRVSYPAGRQTRLILIPSD
jgi:Xaa-Pro aminopeptidase